jgi:hypothetical protein
MTPAREALAPLAKGRSRRATLATRVLAHEPGERWMDQAAAGALRARIERARQQF